MSRYEGTTRASSAARTCRAPASAAVCTTTARTPRRGRVRMIRTAISPRFAIRTDSNIPPSHPEDAVADGLQRCVRGGRQGQGQDPAGVQRVDDAVVPEPGGGVVGVALRLV